MSELKAKAINGIAWNTIQSLSNKSISFLFLIVMARLLLPADYGMVGMLAIFIALADAFVNCGFGQAIIRKQRRTKLDESTVFYFSIGASLICYVILFGIAPLVATFYNMPELCPLLRFLGLKIVVSSFSSMQVLQYSIDLNFKTPAVVKVVSNISSGGIGIWCAFNGWGPWALAIQQVLMASFSTFMYIVLSKWRPIWGFSVTSFKEMFSFGSKLLGANLLNIFYSNLSAIFIGKAYSSSDLGLYSKGQEMAAYPSDLLYGIVNTVTYPLLCTIQNDRDKMTNAYRKIIKSIAFIIFPTMAIVCALAHPIILTLFGEKWAASAFYLAMLCYPCMLVPICTANFSLLQVVGRSDLVLRLEIITKIMGTVMLLITLPISIKAMCIGTIVNVTLCILVNTYYTSRFIDLSQRDQLFDLLKPLICCIALATIIFLVVGVFDNNIVKIIIGTSLGLVIFYGSSAMLRTDEFMLCYHIVKDKIKKS